MDGVILPEKNEQLEGEVMLMLFISVLCTEYTIVQMFGVSNIYKKYSKNGNIVKYYYNLKYLFSSIKYFKM